MKFEKKLRRAEGNFNQTVGLDLKFISYKNLKKQLKQTLTKFKEFQEAAAANAGPQRVFSENLYLESAEKFMGMLCQDILEIAWVYDSQVKNCTQEQRFYLQAFAFLNTEAVRKICKKFDKHVIGEDILGSMMKKLKTQNFFTDIQSLGPYEVGALRQVLVGEGFEDETLPWLSTGAWPQKGDDAEFFKAFLVNEQWKLKRQEGEWPNGIPDFTVGKEDVSFLESLPPQRLIKDDCSAASDETLDGHESDGELEPPCNFKPPSVVPPADLFQSHNNVNTTRGFDAIPPIPNPQVRARRMPPAFDQRFTGYGPPLLPNVPRFAPDWRPPPQEQQITIQNRPQNFGQFRRNEAPFAPQKAFQQPVSHHDAAVTDSESDANVGNLIVNYLPNEWSEIELLAMFSSFGEILSARVIRERFSRRSKGFGFVKFTTDQAAEEAIRGLNGEIACGKRIKVAFAKPRKSRAKANLFVSRFPSDWTSVALKRLFAPYGHIVECRVLRTVEGESKRCGFVRFSNEEDALQAILGLNSSVLPREKVRLRVKVADRERYQQMKTSKIMFSTNI